MKLSQSTPFAAKFAAGAALVLMCSVVTACGDDDDAAPDASSPADAAVDAPPAADADLTLLSSRGLYSDIATHTVVDEAVEYEPVYPLWADEAAKRRWIILPAGTTIDTSDMDHWQFPVGTKFFKEFALDGQLIETRLIEKLADGTFFMGAFVWNEERTEAKLKLNGQQNALGTTHDVPSKARCVLCHKGEAGQILGFSAIQLSKDGAAPTLKSLAADGTLSAPPTPAGTDYRVPGAGTPAQAALGYLHANCGHCHNPSGSAYKDTCIQNPDTGELSDCMLLRLDVAEANDADPLQSAVVKSLVNSVTHSNLFEGTPRVKAGDHEASAIYIRPSQRGGQAQMPPAYSTEVVDDDGVAAIVEWIDSLEP
jgi:hypothetical protein